MQFRPKKWKRTNKLFNKEIVIFKKLLSRYLSNILYKVLGNKKDNNVGIDKFDELLTKPIGFLVMLCVFYFGSSYLDFPSFIDDNFQNIFTKIEKFDGF